MKAISLLVHTKMYITMRTLYSTFMPVSSSWKALFLPTLGAYNAIEFAGYRYRPVAKSRIQSIQLGVLCRGSSSSMLSGSKCSYKQFCKLNPKREIILFLSATKCMLQGSDVTVKNVCIQNAALQNVDKNSLPPLFGTATNIVKSFSLYFSLTRCAGKPTKPSS